MYIFRHPGFVYRCLLCLSVYIWVIGMHKMHEFSCPTRSGTSCHPCWWSWSFRKKKYSKKKTGFLWCRRNFSEKRLHKKIRLVGWLVGFLWHKIHKGHIAPDELNWKGIKKKNKKIWMGIPIQIKVKIIK